MSEIHISEKHFTSAPTDGNRLPKEMAVYELLDKLKIPYEGVDHDVAGTMEECAAVDEALGVTMCKNLGISRLSFAEPEYMEKFLNITPGSVSVLGLMNDKDWYVDLLIDKDLMNDEYIGCHPCINTSSLKIKMDDIIKKFLKYTGHRPRYVKL